MRIERGDNIKLLEHGVDESRIARGATGTVVHKRSIPNGHPNGPDTIFLVNWDDYEKDIVLSESRDKFEVL